MKTRITELLAIEHPIFQAAMSWASSNSALVAAVSNAGGMGVLAGGPMRSPDFKKVLQEIFSLTPRPFGVNIPLNNPRAPELLEIAFQERIPVMVASQGGPREHLAASLKVRPMAMTSPTDFICGPRFSSAPGNFSNCHLGIFTTT